MASKGEDLTTFLQSNNLTRAKTTAIAEDEGFPKLLSKNEKIPEKICLASKQGKSTNLFGFLMLYSVF